MGTTHITITDSDGHELRILGDWQGMAPGDLIAESIDGFPGIVGVRGKTTERLGSGVVAPAVHREGRKITIKGWAHFANRSRTEQPGLVADLTRTITGMWADGTKDGLLRIQHADEDLSSIVQPTPGSQWKLDTSLDYRGWLRYQIELLAEDPHLYGQARTYQIVPAGSQFGLHWPLFEEDNVLTWGVMDNAQVMIRNDGNAAALPVAQVIGDFPSGFRLGDGTGHWVTWQRPVAMTSPVVIDFASHAVTVDGSDQSWALTTLDFWQIPPGGRVSPILEPLQAGGGHVFITVCDTYL